MSFSPQETEKNSEIPNLPNKLAAINDKPELRKDTKSVSLFALLLNLNVNRYALVGC